MVKDACMDVERHPPEVSFAFPVAVSSPFSGGLTRYHSAPSTVFANLLDEDLLSDEYREPNQLSQTNDFNFTGLLYAEIDTRHALCDKDQTNETAVAGVSAKEVQGQERADTRSMEDFPYVSSIVGATLSSISEHGCDEPLPDFYEQQMPMAMHQQTMEKRTSNVDNAQIQSFVCGSNSLQSESGFVDHTSSPTDFFSSTPMDEYVPLFSDVVDATSEVSSRPPSIASSLVSGVISGQTVNTWMESYPASTTYAHLSPSEHSGSSHVNDVICTSASLVVNTNMRSLAGMNSNALVRHSSSPAELLSQWSKSALPTSDEKISMPSSSGDSSEDQSFDARYKTCYSEQAATSTSDGCQTLDDAACGQRKRGRQSQLKGSQGFGARLPAEVIHRQSVLLPEDSVLCKARARRGCATDPRSISERVRRTKISDKMKKLHELVPRSDKQMNTADMLDEAVEYIKYLQCQIQELSANRCQCEGKLQPKAMP